MDNGQLLAPRWSGTAVAYPAALVFTAIVTSLGNGFAPIGTDFYRTEFCTACLLVRSAGAGALGTRSNFKFQISNFKFTHLLPSRDDYTECPDRRSGRTGSMGNLGL